MASSKEQLAMLNRQEKTTIELKGKLEKMKHYQEQEFKRKERGILYKTWKQETVSDFVQDFKRKECQILFRT